MEDYYAYLGKPVVRYWSANPWCSQWRRSDDRDNACPSGGSVPKFDPSDGSSNKEDPLGLTGTCIDSDSTSKIGLQDLSDSFPGTARVMMDSPSSAESDMSIAGYEAGDRVVLQRYEENWINDFIDTDDDANIEDHEKLKVLVLPTIADAATIAGPSTSREPEVD